MTLSMAARLSRRLAARSVADRIADELGTTPDTFVYPFGAYTAVSESLIRDLGFAASLSCESGVTTVRGPDSLYGMKRWIRPSGSSSDAYFAKIGLK